MDLSNLSLPEGFSCIIVDGEIIKGGNSLLALREHDQTQHWISIDQLVFDQTSDQSISLNSPYSNVDLENIEDVEEITQNQSDHQKGEKRRGWTKEETLLINLIETHKSKIEDPRIKRKTVFESISNEMKFQSDKMYTPTTSQVENRWKSLLKKFKEIKDHNSQSGNDKRDWPYFDMIAAILGERPNIKPVAGCSSVQLLDTNENQVDNLRNQLEQKLQEKNKKQLEGPTPRKKVKQERQKSNVRSELLKFLKDHEKSNAQREEEKIDMLKKQHEELKSFMETILKNMNKDNEN